MDRVKAGAGAVLLGAVLLAGLAAVALLVVSPASFVGLLPGWFTEGGSTRTAALAVAVLSATMALVLAVRSGPGSRFRGALITVLVVAGVGFGLLAAKAAPAPGGSPSPANTCVAYSGGSQTCPGG